MPFKDLGAYVLDEATLRLPVDGKVYKIDPVPADIGLRAQTIVTLGLTATAAIEAGRDVPGVSERDKQILSDSEERDLYGELLGDAYDEMITDGVPWLVLKHAAITVMIDCTADRESAEAFWASLGKRPETADRKPSKKVASNGTGAARRTRARASTVGTTSRQN